MPTAYILINTNIGYEQNLLRDLRKLSKVKNADIVQKRLVDIEKRHKWAKKTTPELPEKLPLHNLDVSWRVFQLMEAFGWQFLPSQIMAEPDWLIEDLLALRGQKGIVERMLED